MLRDYVEADKILTGLQTYYQAAPLLQPDQANVSSQQRMSRRQTSHETTMTASSFWRSLLTTTRLNGNQRHSTRF